MRAGKKGGPMADNGKTLKWQNWKYILAPYVAVNVIVFIVVVTGVEDVWRLSKAALNSAAVSVVLGILTLVLNGLLSADNKARLVFWRMRHPLPGCRSFSRYVHEDPRVDPKVLETRFGPLPSAPDDQNRLWYRIYKARGSEPSNADAHRSYLAMRDLAALTAMFLLTFVPAAFFLVDDRSLWTYYTGVLGVAYLLMSQAARTYGRRLVTNVLATETASD